MNRTKPYLIMLGVLILWTAGSFFGIFNAYLLPPPWRIVATASKLIASGVLIHHTATSFFRVIIGFIITICFAFPMGVLVGLHKGSRAIWEPPLNFLRHIPPLAMIPMAFTMTNSEMKDWRKNVVPLASKIV